MRSLIGLMVFATIFVVPSCASVGALSDEELAASVKKGSYNATSYGLNFVLQQNPDKVDEIKSKVKVGKLVVDDVILRTLRGASSEDITRLLLDELLKALSDQLSPVIKSAIQLAIDVALDKVQLPSNPTDKLTPRIRLVLIGLFEGMSDAMGEAVPTDSQFKHLNSNLRPIENLTFPK